MRGLFVLSLIFSIDAIAGLGRVVQQDQLFDQLCLLDYGTDQIRYSEICTGVLVDQNTVLTAAHCVEQGLPQKISCGPSSFPVTAAQVLTHPKFNAHWSIGNISYIKNDIAILKLATSVPALEVPFMSMEELGQAQQCAFFGFSKLSTALRTGKRTSQIGWEINKSVLDFWHEIGMIRMQGLAAGGGLTEVGDSGGPLLCRQKNGSWRLLGIASSRDFAYQAFFTPVKSYEFPIATVAGSEDLRAEALRQSKVASLTAAAEMFKELMVQIKRIPEIAALASEIDPTMNYENAYRSVLGRLFSQAGGVGRLKAFSIFQRSDDSRFYSIGDLAFNYFTVEKIDFEEGYAIGTLQVLGPSENFMCHGDLLCQDETIPSVRTRIENLLIYKRN